LVSYLGVRDYGAATQLWPNWITAALMSPMLTVPAPAPAFDGSWRETDPATSPFGIGPPRSNDGW